MTTELYRTHRPRNLKQVFGQDRAIRTLQGFLHANTLPHQLLFTGPSGCGKTTLARILREKLDCSDRDFAEVNCADFRGIDLVREIRRAVNLHPIGGTTRIWLIDEAHKLTNDAQNALLKLIEEPPTHVYFFLATTDPGKLLKTVQTRCTEIQTALLTVDATRQLIDYVLAKEKKQIADDVKAKLIEAAEGSGRKALVILQTVLGLEDEEEQLRVILSATSSGQAIQIARALMNPRTKWSEMAAVLKIVDEDPESLRRMILGYASATLLGNNAAIHSRAYMILVAFTDHFFDTGRAGLITACYEVCSKSTR